MFQPIFSSRKELLTNELFYTVAKLRFGITIKVKRGGLKHNNNHIERYNQNIKDRIKTMRNFGSDKGAENFLNLRHIIHNFVNPHMQLKGNTPAESAGIDLKLGRRKTVESYKVQGKDKDDDKMTMYFLDIYL